jgi:two-component system OmpR family sensor kinase
MSLFRSGVTVPADRLEIRRPWVRTRLGARAFQLWFAIPAASIAVYATVLSGETNVWQTASLCWMLAGLVIGLIARIASMIERCEREADQNEGGPVALPVERRRAMLWRASLVAEERLAHLEHVIVRQHQFVSDAAHELRTPLTAQSVVGESVLARQGATAAQLREAIVSMLEESKHMKRLIEGLLDLTRASLTNVAEPGVSRQPVALDLSELVRDCVESLRVLAEEKAQSIEVNATTAVWADADLTMVRQALLNVIHNAIEHCPEGTCIQLDTVRCLPDEAQIRVRDNGPGIPLEEQRWMFERFYRGARASRQRSLGLGLSIAKAVLCSQGGGIALSSTPGRGCCFLLTLPLAARRHR